TEEKVLSALRAILPADRTDAEMPRTEAFRPDGSDVRERVEEAKARQGRMVLGYHLPYSGEESAIANLFIEAFSASPVSRLFMNVRERLNLCYYCSASVDVSINTMMIRSGISEKNVEKAKAEIAHQLNDIASGGLSDEELETARITVLGSLKTLKDSQASLGEWYLRRIAIGAPSDIDALMQGVECVTAEQVAEFAGRIRHCTSYFLRGTEE
ncbi:MAG: insulinase family protein, partial [Clostridia bacterium]|nr:insulinase family protein [Clostridia bacterium]